MKLVKTEAGQRVLKDRSVPLTPRQRAAFILFDGRNTVDQVLASTGVAGVTREDVEHLIAVGLLELVEGGVSTPGIGGPAAPSASSAAPAAQASGRSAQQRYQEAYLVATKLTAKLGLKGFRLNLAVEGAGSYDQLRELAPRIREAVGDVAYVELDRALNA